MASAKKPAARKTAPKSIAKAAAAKELDFGAEMPLDYMLRVMRDAGNSPARRDAMAKACAPFVHPKLAAMEHTGKDRGPVETHKMSDHELARRAAFLLTRAARKLSKKKS